MKVLISDFDIQNSLLERDYILQKRPDWEVSVYQYTGNEKDFARIITQADALLTAFIPIDKEILDAAGNLKCISLDATGFSNIDVDYAREKNITVMAIEEYCTQEVAEHTMSLILALCRGLKFYIRDVEQNKNWQYSSCYSLKRIEGQKLGIFGFGRIGRAVAKRAKAFGMEVYVCDEYIENTGDEEIIKTDKEFILKNCNIISNHMALTKKNYQFFNYETFMKMEQKPFFINAGRGGAVDEKALCEALDKGFLSGAGLDVLESEMPKLEGNKLLGRDNCIITPHAAFYSEESEYLLRKISCDNLIYFLENKQDMIHRIVN